MPPDPIANWLLELGVNPEALVFGFVLGSIMFVGIVIARRMAKDME